MADHEILGGNLDLSILLVVPIIWIGLQVVKGRFFLSQESAETRQKRWQKNTGSFGAPKVSIASATTNFIMSLFKAVTLLCLFAGFVNVVVSIGR